MSLTEMGHSQPPTPTVVYSATGDVFFNDNIFQRSSRVIDMQFYWVVDRVNQGQFLVYWIDGEHNLVDYFTNHYPTSQHRSQRMTYLVSAEDASRYACYMSPNDMRGYVESLPVQGNIQRTEKFSHLHVKEMDDGHMDTNSPNRQTRYRRR